MAQDLAYYTTSEVARRAHVDSSTVRVWVATGKLKSIPTLGGHHRFERGLIDELFPPAEADQAGAA